MNTRQHGIFFEAQQRAGHAWGTDPGAYDPDFVAAHLKWLRLAFGPGRWFDTQVTGWHHIPDGASMVVGNHSGGTTLYDAWGMIACWYDEMGVHRPVHGLAHELLFATRATGRHFERLGVLRADRTTARRVVHEYDRPFAVMPGGDRDVWRPSSKRHQVHFAGRTGYARTAIQLGVPIVPIAHVGAHETLWVLSDGHRAARFFGIHKLVRADIFPVHVSMPWGLAVGPWPHLPPPTHFAYRFGAPLAPPAWDDPEAPVPAALVKAYDAQVRASLQGLLDELVAERVTWLDRVRENLSEKVEALRDAAREASQLGLGWPAR
jgi:1-acyl-sn-glycerol-3-phosphate acyltransferase